MSVLSERIKELRKKQGFTQDEVATMLDMKRANFSSYETGRTIPPGDTLGKLASIFETTTEYLLGKTDNPHPTDESLLKAASYIVEKLNDSITYFLSLCKGDYVFSRKLQNDVFEVADKAAIETNESFQVDLDPNNLYEDLSKEVMKRSTDFKLKFLDGIKKVVKKYHLWEDPRDIYGETSSSKVEMVQIPIYGEIRAGYGSLAQEDIIGYEITSRDSVGDGEYFYLIVKGDSMIDEGIYEGMRVLVRKQNYCQHGKIGVVIVDGEEGTLKRVYYEDDTVVLRASNRRIPPRPYPLEEVIIQGQVTKVEFDV